MKQPKNRPRSLQQKVDYLKSHFRYFTMNSWNGLSSYANKIKISSVELPAPYNTSKVRDSLYEFLESEDAFFGFHEELSNFSEKNNYEYSIEVNGRSGGYLVLCESKREKTDHLSYCPQCYQKNFTRFVDLENFNIEDKEFVGQFFCIERAMFVGMDKPEGLIKDMERLAIGGAPQHKQLSVVYHEIIKKYSFDEIVEIVSSFKKNNRPAVRYTVGGCGACHHEKRINHDFYTVRVSGKSIDSDIDWGNWRDHYSSESLKQMFQVVWDFDIACWKAIMSYVHFCTSHVLEEQTIMVPKKILVAVEKEGS